MQGWTEPSSTLQPCALAIQPHVITDPIGAIWAGAMMLEHLGHTHLHDRIVGAIERVVASGKSRTPDLGGSAKTTELADAIRSEI
jgi:tartrate dehydrogenase/decarboxylase/D-malate dehydrogenase